MYKDLIVKLNRYIIIHKKSVNNNISEYTTTYDLLNYNLSQLNKVIDNFDIISYVEKIELLEAIEDEFHIKHTSSEYDSVFHSRKKDDLVAKEEAIKVFESTINELNNRIENVRIRIDYLSLQTYEYSPLLSFFDEETYELKKPIDTKERFDLLIRFLNTFPIPERTKYLNRINKDNLALFIKRDRKFEEEILEAKKREALIKLSKDSETKREIELQTVTGEESKLTDEEKQVLDKAIQIIEDNKDILESISKEAISGFEIISETGEHIYELADYKTNYEITLLDINDLIRRNNIEYSKENFRLLEQAFKSYDTYKIEVDKLEEIKRSIKDFEEENFEDLEIINRLVKKYNKIMNNLTDKEKGFLISIENEYNNEEIPFDVREKNIMNICTGSRISLAFYKRYKKLEELSDIFVLYNSYDLETKKDLLDEMISLVDEISELDDTTGIDKTNDDEAKLNDVLYLTLQDKTFGVSDFIYSDDREHYLGKISQIKKILSKFETYDIDDIHNKTKTIKGQPLYKDKIRRVSSGQVRVPYIPLNSLWNTNIPLDKPCYIVISAGFKKGEKALYEYVNTQRMVNSVQDFIKKIQNELDMVRLQCNGVNPEEQVKNRFNEILKKNHNEFEKVLEIMEKDFILSEDRLENENNMEEEGDLSL